MAWSAHRNVEYARQHVTRYAGVLLVREVAMSTASGRTGATRSPEVHIAWLVTGVPALLCHFKITAHKKPVKMRHRLLRFPASVFVFWLCYKM